MTYPAPDSTTPTIATTASIPRGNTTATSRSSGSQTCRSDAAIRLASTPRRPYVISSAPADSATAFGDRSTWASSRPASVLSSPDAPTPIPFINRRVPHHQLRRTGGLLLPDATGAPPRGGAAP